MQLNINIVTALVGVLGVLLGALVQYLFGQRVELARHYQGLRTASYVDFIKSIAGIAMAQKMKSPERELEFSIMMVDAKSRIGIYGSEPVVAATAEFFRRHGALTSALAFSSFLAIVAPMRSETPGGETAISTANLSQLLFGVDA